jgi:hypothetical protein
MSRNLTVVALLAAAAGFVLQMVAGVTNTPTIPPGLVVLLAAAALVAFTSWRWAFLALGIPGWGGRRRVQPPRVRHRGRGGPAL